MGDPWSTGRGVKIPKPTARVRRSPEAARTHVLDAADQVFARDLPDAVGLREIAAQAGVSHGLVTHYFGTYDALVDAAIERRSTALRNLAFARLATENMNPSESPLLDLLVEALADRTLARLVAWSILKHRQLGSPGQLGRLVNAMHVRLRSVGIVVPYDRLEFSVVAAITMMVGWSVASSTIDRVVGHGEFDTPRLRSELRRMMRAYLAAP
jgi:AcrR family transcriptional regulator